MDACSDLWSTVDAHPLACFFTSASHDINTVVTLTSLESIISALNEAGVRYLIVGGLAVAAHGHGRVTVDVDLVVQLTELNVQKALSALGALGYTPIVPVPASDFAEAAKRKQWVEERNMVVFSLRSEQHPLTPVDIFASEPFDFESEHARALVGEVGPGNLAHFVCLQTLIRMKEATGRPKDEDDIRHLKLLMENLNEQL